MSTLTRELPTGDFMYERLGSLQGESSRWEKEARKLERAGKTAAAREALRRKRSADTAADSLRPYIYPAYNETDSIAF